MTFNWKLRITIFISLAVLTFSHIGFTAAQGEQTLTPQTLATFNGQNGARAYVAVNGQVYDLTDVQSWTGGRHFCPSAIAGKDITFLWNFTPKSHRNSAFLKRFPVVGKLVAAQPKPSSTPPTPPPPKTPSLAKTLTLALLIAIMVTAIWMGFRLRKK